MITLYDAITVMTAVIAFLFLLVFYKLDRLQATPRSYLYYTIINVGMLLFIDLLVGNQQWETASYFFSLYVTAFFLLYPLMYSYFASFEITSEETTPLHKIRIWVLPVLMCCITSVFMLMMNKEEEHDLIASRFWGSGSGFRIVEVFQVVVIGTYYSQFVFYIYKLRQLVKRIRVPEEKNRFSFWVQFFITGAIIYEAGLFILYLTVPLELVMIIEQFYAFLFLTFTGVLGVSHTSNLIHHHIHSLQIPISDTETIAENNEAPDSTEFNDTFDEDSEAVHEPGKLSEPLTFTTENHGSEHQVHAYYKMSQKEKAEIKKVFEHFLKETRVFLDPNLKMDTLSRKIHISSKKLSIVLNEVYGKSFSQIINEFRIHYALQLLRQPDLHIEEVGQKSGFNSRSTFIRAFKSVVGTLPSDYKSSLSQKPTSKAQ